MKEKMLGIYIFIMLIFCFVGCNTVVQSLKKRCNYTFIQNTSLKGLWECYSYYDVGEKRRKQQQNIYVNFYADGKIHINQNDRLMAKGNLIKGEKNNIRYLAIVPIVDKVDNYNSRINVFNDSDWVFNKEKFENGLLDEDMMSIISILDYTINITMIDSNQVLFISKPVMADSLVLKRSGH